MTDGASVTQHVRPALARADGLSAPGDVDDAGDGAGHRRRRHRRARRAAYFVRDRPPAPESLRRYHGARGAVRSHGAPVHDLSVLSRHGAPLSTSQLARRAFMTPQSMSEVIHALERKGLIKRNPHPNHRRTLPATLTGEGRRVLAACERQ